MQVPVTGLAPVPGVEDSSVCTVQGLTQSPTGQLFATVDSLLPDPTPSGGASSTDYEVTVLTSSNSGATWSSAYSAEEPYDSLLSQ
jgi:hypothetical protein